MRSALAALLAFVPAVAGQLRMCALSSAYKPTLEDTCSSAAVNGGASSTLDIHAARGEVEGGQILLDNGDGSLVSNAQISLAWDAGAAPGGVFVTGPLLVAYVHTEKSPRYAGSATGWYADALIQWPTPLPIPAAGQVTAWLSFNVSAEAAPGSYAGIIHAGNASLVFSVTVYQVVVPPLSESPFSAVYAFDSSAPKQVYGAAADENSTLRAYLDVLAGLRFPATNIYANAPLPEWQYEYLAAQGAPILILADISSLPFTTGSSGGTAVGGTISSRRRKAVGRLADCPTFDQAYINQMVALLQPAWDALGALGVQSRATVYGFDEIDAACEPVVRQLFAAAKAAFPGVRTLSAIDWPSVPLDLPLDVWVLQYQLVNRSITDPWIAAGHELFVYHCIEPSEPGFLNSFNERALIEARLLFWYDFAIDVTGHLYYEDALWLPWTTVPPFWASYTTASNVSFEVGLAPLASRVPDARLLTWDPANWIWAPRTDIWANGDGLFLYPGPVVDRVGAPVSTVRFEAQRDGVEDWHVMRAVANRTLAKTIAGAMVSAPTVWQNNVTALAEARRVLLALASATGV